MYFTGSVRDLYADIGRASPATSHCLEWQMSPLCTQLGRFAGDVDILFLVSQ
jgi:hypothetical protein